MSQISELYIQIDKLIVERDEGLAREAQKNLVIDGLSLENQELQQRLVEAEKLLRSNSDHMANLVNFILLNCQGNGIAHAERSHLIAYAALKQQQVTNAFLPDCANMEKGNE